MIIHSNTSPVAVGDSFQFWSNQATRPARVVAIRDDGLQVVIEYIMPNRRTYLIRVSEYAGPGAWAISGKDLKALARDEGDRRHSLGLDVRPLGRCPAWAREQIASDRRADQRLALWDELDGDRPMTREQLRRWGRLEREALRDLRILRPGHPRLSCEEHNTVTRRLALEIMDGGL